jgi:hypothetical protein
VFPILAIVEGQSNYEQVPIEDNEDAKQETKARPSPIEDGDALRSRPVTSSVRAMHRLLCSLGRWTSVFRGFGLLVFTTFCEVLIVSGFAFVPIVPSVVSQVIAALLVVQLQTVWVHSVIGTATSKSFRQRLTGFKTTFRATAIPTVLLQVATLISVASPIVVLHLLKVATEKPMGDFVEVPKLDNNPKNLWTMAVFLAVHAATYAVLCIPALVVLTRIQASLLPVDERTIVPVDRAFELEGSDDKGYLSMAAAFKSFKGSWTRLYKLYVKIAIINFLGQALLAVIMCLEFVFVMLIFAPKASPNA